MTISNSSKLARYVGFWLIPYFHHHQRVLFQGYQSIYHPPLLSMPLKELSLTHGKLKVCNVSTCPLNPPPPTGSFSRPSIYLLPTLLSVLLKEFSWAHEKLIWRYCMEQLALHDSECWWETIQVWRTTNHWFECLSSSRSQNISCCVARSQKDYWEVYDATGVWEGNNKIIPKLTAFSDTALMESHCNEDEWPGIASQMFGTAPYIPGGGCPTGVCFNSRSEAKIH